jgi:hypothetical protein
MLAVLDERCYRGIGDQGTLVEIDFKKMRTVRCEGHDGVVCDIGALVEFQLKLNVSIFPLFVEQRKIILV